MKSTTIGKTRHLVRLDEPGPPAPDGDGGWTEGSIPLDPPDWYCSIEAATAYGIEREIAGTVSATASHLIKGRFHPGISVTTRIWFTDVQRGGAVRRFDVESVRSLSENGTQLAILVHEVVTPPTASTAAEVAPAAWDNNA